MKTGKQLYEIFASTFSWLPPSWWQLDQETRDAWDRVAVKR